MEKQILFNSEDDRYFVYDEDNNIGTLAVEIAERMQNDLNDVIGRIGEAIVAEIQKEDRWGALFMTGKNGTWQGDRSAGEIFDGFSAKYFGAIIKSFGYADELEIGVNEKGNLYIEALHKQIRDYYEFKIINSDGLRLNTYHAAQFLDYGYDDMPEEEIEELKKYSKFDKLIENFSEKDMHILLWVSDKFSRRIEIPNIEYEKNDKIDLPPFASSRLTEAMRNQLIDIIIAKKAEEGENLSVDDVLQKFTPSYPNEEQQTALVKYLKDFVAETYQPTLFDEQKSTRRQR